MKVIEKKMLRAIANGKNFTLANTEVEFSKLVNGNFTVYLFGNRIANGNIRTKKVNIYNCGFFTNTTKSRLNALITTQIRQKQFRWYVGECEFVEGMTCDLNI